MFHVYGSEDLLLFRWCIRFLELPQITTEWLKTAEVSSLTILEAKSQGVGETESFWRLRRVCPAPLSWLLMVAVTLGVPWLAGAPLVSLPLALGLVPWESVCPYVFT